jgi:hypothetical protein
MIEKRERGKQFIAVGVSALLIVTLIALVFGLAWPPMLTQAGPTLPPIDPPPTPTEIPDKPDKSDDDDEPIVAHIELQVAPAQSAGWSVVQWQGSDGNWHDVEGWRGSLSDGSSRRWAVEGKDFGTGPFRWVVLDGASGSVAGASDLFSLPASANETVQVTITLP